MRITKSNARKHERALLAHQRFWENCMSQYFSF